MSTGEKKPAIITTGNKWVDGFLERYGQMTFGFSMFLILWFAILSPEIERNRINFDSQREVVSAMEKTATSIEQSSRTMQATAETLDRVCDRLNQ